MEITVLFYLTPVIYMLGAIIHKTSVYALKDVFMAVICARILYYDITHHHCFSKREVYFLFFMYLYIIVDSLIQFDDFLFWLFGIREMIITPIMLIIIGQFLRNQEVDWLSFIKKALLFTLVLTVGYAVIFRYSAYGPSGRLRSFWDSEHEPGIISAMTIIAWTISYRKRHEKKDGIILVMSIIFGSYCILLTKSRSVMIGLFLALLCMYYRKISLKNVILSATVIALTIFLYNNYSNLTGRRILHNLAARENQYIMAFKLISNYPIFGIGIDKYGAIAGRSKAFFFANSGTVTMDSTLLKYTVNLGLVFTVCFFALLFRVYKHGKKMENDAFPLVIFSLGIGAVTSKLGAYPINQYLFTYIGYVLLRIGKRYMRSR